MHDQALAFVEPGHAFRHRRRRRLVLEITGAGVFPRRRGPAGAPRGVRRQVTPAVPRRLGPRRPPALPGSGGEDWRVGRGHGGGLRGGALRPLAVDAGERRPPARVTGRVGGLLLLLTAAEKTRVAPTPSTDLRGLVPQRRLAWLCITSSFLEG
ncbi:hypothetical protein MUK42_20671 [Musa troglodytarum]|uniref:Uncharacterized protein n=1 Tax=Musa troglodytarum TaxID=320322 RepID=A0A9E7FVG1_9LILI|nr:hypothetical protein MUK42_20671 [Musa troglodytarum]